MFYNTYKTNQNQTLVIRIPDNNDARNLLKYIDKVSSETDFLTFGPGEYEVSLEDEKKFIETCRKSSNKIILIAEIKNEIIGCLIFRGGDRLRTQHTGEFGISVTNSCWRIGIGSILIENLVNWAKSTSIIKKINLRVRSDNTKAIKLYERFDFVREGLITKEIHISGRFYDNIFMGLQIDS